MSNITKQKGLSRHNYLNIQKSNAHTKINGNLVQLWFGNTGRAIPSIFDYISNNTNNNNKVDSREKSNYSGMSKIALLGALAASTAMIPAYAAPEPITGIITDFNGFTQADENNLNDDINGRPAPADSAHNLLSYTSNGITYSTGVNDAELIAQKTQFTPGNYAALEPALTTSNNAGQGASDDGSQTTHEGQIYPTPSTGSGYDVSAYLKDGINGLGMSTFANNVGGTFIFDLSNIDPSTVGDGTPDFLYFNIAHPSDGLIKFSFFDKNNTQVGKTVAKTESSNPNIFVVRNDRFFTSNGKSSGKDKTQAVQGFSVEFEDFGITQSQLGTVITRLVVELPLQADPPFIAYNTDAFVAKDPLTLVVEISEDSNDDGVISYDEIIGNADVSVIIPKGASESDTVNITDGTTTLTYVLTAKDISNGVLKTSFTTPADGEVLGVSATLTNTKGTLLSAASDNARIDKTVPAIVLQPIITIDNVTQDNVLIAKEAEADVAITGVISGDFNGEETALLTVNKSAYKGAVNAKGAYSINVPGAELAKSKALSVSVTTEDQWGNTGTATKEKAYSVDITAPDAPTVVINDGGDEILSKAEIDAGVTATITTPKNAVAGDVLLIDTNGDGKHDQKIELTEKQATGGTVEVEIDSAQIPADGVLKVTAEIVDTVGNISQSGGDKSAIDSTAPDAPTVVINDGGDEILSKAEIDAGVTATITTPKNAVAGDVLLIDTNGDGKHDQKIELTEKQATGGTVEIEIDSAQIPADGVLKVTAEIVDTVGNISQSGGDKSAIDSTAPDAPTVVINDGGDEILSKAEIDAGVTATITTPKNAVAGDVLLIDTNGDGKHDQKIELTEKQATGGTVEIEIDSAQIPADGVLKVTAEIVDTVGNTSQSGGDKSAIDSTAPDAPTVVINDGGDEILSKAEIDAGVTATITTPKNAVAGDVLLIDTNGDGKHDQKIELTEKQATGGTVEIEIDSAQIPADGVLKVTAEIVDTVGNTSQSGGDKSAIDSTAPDAPTVVINDGGDEILSKAEIDAGVTATITTPKNAVAGDVLLIDTNGDGKHDQKIELTEKQATGGTVEVEIDSAQIPADGVLKVTAEIVDTVGNISQSGGDKSAIDSTAPDAPTVVINDGGDEILSKAEIDAGVTATITTPKNAVAGDVLLIDTNGDGKHDQKIELTEKQATGGTVEVEIDSAQIPADGVLVVTAEIVDTVGNTSQSGGDKSAIDSTAPDAPTVVINDGGDEILSKAEIDAGVTATITTPANSVAGDVLTIDTNGDGKADQTIILDRTQAAGGTVDITVDPTHVPADGVLVVSVEVTDIAGNPSKSIDDKSITDSTLPSLTAEDVGPISDNTPLLKGTTDQADGSTVTVKDEKGNTICSAMVTSGEWSCESTVALPYGKAKLVAEISDPAGNLITTKFTAEIEVDIDNDGLVNSQDLDDDNDGIPDVVEEGGNPLKDTDGDGIIDSLDLDSDNDGMLDIIEAGGEDTDNNGVVDDTTDTDQDGLADSMDVNPNAVDSPTDVKEGTAISILPITDTDGDGISDFQDIDSDNDGISDLIEAGIGSFNDIDNNGEIDGPVDGSGITTMLTPIVEFIDTDKDGIPDFKDLDSDNDGINDVQESGASDTNGDGISDTPNNLVDGANLPDVDGNNIPDVLEPNNPAIPSVLDADGDGVFDDITDKDKDGIPDISDATDGFGDLADVDGDGIIDSIDLDDDNDGIPDLVEQAGNPALDTDGDGVLDSQDLDSDNDGLLDIIEAGGTDINNDGVVDSEIDSDSDGLADIVDVNTSVIDTPKDANEAALITTLPVVDTDEDGTPNFQDIDSDNDGVSDLVEAGIASTSDTDNDGRIDVNGETHVNENGIPTPFISITDLLDTDGDGSPNYIDLDSDNDGIHDTEEAGSIDEDGNGFIDTPNELIDSSLLPDENDNGTPDIQEPNNPTLLAVLDTNSDGVIDDATDSDGDGIPDDIDSLEGFGDFTDTDGDGIADNIDMDDDNDGIPDLVEDNGLSGSDTDGDGVLNSKDLDSDNDGILDIEEAGGVDTNNDGRVDDNTDSDGDGLADVVDNNPNTQDTPTDEVDAINMTALPVTDTDENGVPDFKSLDSDNDGISDLVEGGASPMLDANNDGTLDSSTDSDGDGISDVIDPDSGNSLPTVPDTDNDGTPNYQDLDSDNDGLTDIFEAGGIDDNGDGVVDTLGLLIDGNNFPDTDGDGVSNVTQPSNPNLTADVDADGDGVIDDMKDTDGDGVPDVADITPTSFGVLLDTDRDGVPDIYDVDDDNDGIPDIVEQNSAQNGGDTDGDGIPDELDLDSDSDGIRDFHEGGLTLAQIEYLDTNNDGVIDAPVGLNGLADSIETDDTESAGIDFNSDGVVDDVRDTDGDGRPDYQDLDSDNDGIFDLEERGSHNIMGSDGYVMLSLVDVNHDGIVDDFASDEDGDGIANSIDDNDTFIGGFTVTPADLDSDGIANYRDLDSDGDGISDLNEGGVVVPAIVDADRNGVIDNHSDDNDGDGISDSCDMNPTEFGGSQDSLMSDMDNDGIPDYLDLDSDNDGISDVIEAGLIDVDGDGIDDTGLVSQEDAIDTDGDGIPDYRELDSDGDGVFDISMTQHFELDADDDGMIDDAADADNDGIPDVNDLQLGSHGSNGTSTGYLETAISGSGGTTAPLSVLMLGLLYAFRRLGGVKLLKRFLPMLLVAIFILPSVMPNTAMADVKTVVNHMPEYQERNYKEIVDRMSESQKKKEIDKRRCGTGLIFNDHYKDFTVCNYVLGGFVKTHVHPRGNEGGYSTSDNSSNGINVAVGRHFNPRWFGELSYTDMGAATISNINPLMSDEKISYKVPSLHLGYLMRAPENRLNFYIKGGVSAIQNEASSPKVPYKKLTNIQSTFGFGAQWQPVKNSGLFVRVGADLFDKDAISAGINIGYKFKGTTKRYEPID